jgi:hypothetical protein
VVSAFSSLRWYLQGLAFLRALFSQRRGLRREAWADFLHPQMLVPKTSATHYGQVTTKRACKAACRIERGHRKGRAGSRVKAGAPRTLVHYPVSEMKPPTIAP